MDYLWAFILLCFSQLERKLEQHFQLQLLQEGFETEGASTNSEKVKLPLCSI